MRDSGTVLGQLYEALDKNRTAARILDYFLGLHAWKAKRHPGQPADSPELYLDFTIAQLAEKLLVCEKTVRNALNYLSRRRLITKHQARGFDRSYRYELHRSRVETLYQELPIITAIEQNLADAQPVENTASIRQPLPDACGNGYRFDAVKITACIYPPIPSFNPSSSSSAIDDDDKLKRENEKDQERDSLIEQYRTLSISREVAESHLESHSRPLIAAGLAHLQRRRRRGDRVTGTAYGFLTAFYADPARWEHERDAYGCWRHVSEIKRQETARKAQEAAPAPDHAQRAKAAWEELPGDQKEAIRLDIEARHPLERPAGVLAMCREEALRQQETILQ